MAPANNQKARKKSRKERVISYRTLPKQSGGGLERSAVSSARSGVQNVGVLVGQTRPAGQESFAIMDNPMLFLDLSSARLQCGQFGFVLEKIAGGAGVSAKGRFGTPGSLGPAIRLASTNIADILRVCCYALFDDCSNELRSRRNRDNLLSRLLTSSVIWDAPRVRRALSSSGASFDFAP